MKVLNESSKKVLSWTEDEPDWPPTLADIINIANQEFPKIPLDQLEVSSSIGISESESGSDTAILNLELIES